MVSFLVRGGRMDSARIDVEERMFNGDDRYWVEEAKGAEVFANNTFAQVYLPKRTFPITLTRYQWNKPISRKTKFKHPGINKNKKTKRGEGFREEDYDHKPAREFRIDKTAPNDDSCTISELTQSGSLSAPDIPIVPFKRSHEEALGHVVVVEEAAAPKRVRLPEGWSVRVGRMGGKNRYGDRASIKVDSFLGPGRDDLKHYSLIIPAFTQCSGIIPSGKDKQRALPWLWNTCEHPRFFGVLDMDMETQAVFEGQEPLFRGMPAVPYEKLSHVKKAFTQRLVSGSTFGQLLAQCPSFALLYRTVRALDLALQVPHVTYFSGGGGFRVLFYSPLAWRLVTWGQTYALTFHDEQLEGLLHQVAPTLEQPPLDYLLYRTDKNIYDSDKGTKPDLLAHFSTHVYPRQLDESFERSRPSCDQADEPLFKAIRAFWQRVFESIPLEAPRIVAPLSKPASIYYANVLYDFPKAPSYEKATHFALQNNKTSYRCVPNVETLYQRLLNQRASGLPLNFHEMRTPVTRHALDYDGGPPLLQPLRRRDGLMETPLHAIQEVLSSPPSPSCFFFDITLDPSNLGTCGSGRLPGCPPLLSSASGKSGNACSSHLAGLAREPRGRRAHPVCRGDRHETPLAGPSVVDVSRESHQDALPLFGHDQQGDRLHVQSTPSL